MTNLISNNIYETEAYKKLEFYQNKKEYIINQLNNKKYNKQVFAELIEDVSNLVSNTKVFER